MSHYNNNKNCHKNALTKICNSHNGRTVRVKPYLSVVIESCDLQGGGSSSLKLQYFCLWVACWLEVRGIVEVNGDVDKGQILLLIHWVVV